MRVLNVFRGIAPPTRVKDIESLNLPAYLERRISKQAHKERMLWELWIESAGSFAELRKNLKKRGYKNLPLHGPAFYHHKSVTTEREKEEIEITAKKRMMLRKRDANPGV